MTQATLTPDMLVVIDRQGNKLRGHMKPSSELKMHRAFYDVFGLGPISFLRHKRLCAIHSVLRESDPAKVTVAQVAVEHGFIELGRFSHYYHSLFGEYPSETLGSRGFRARKEIDPNFTLQATIGINGN